MIGSFYILVFTMAWSLKIRDIDIKYQRFCLEFGTVMATTISERKVSQFPSFDFVS